jgi:hypothetical protein
MIKDNQLETAQKMRELLNEARKNRKAETASEPITVTVAEFESWLPSTKDDEFLLRIQFENKTYLCCMREPTWREAVEIEMYAFRKSQDGREYFAGEYERRELLKKSLRWIAETSTKNIHNTDISQLSYDFVVQLWEHASKVFFVQFGEAQALYASAKSFFSGELGHPVHPVILDVDGIIKRVFVFNATEWRAVKMSDYERYQIVWMAYSELESSIPTQSDSSETSPSSDPRLRALLGRMNRR